MLFKGPLMRTTMPSAEFDREEDMSAHPENGTECSDNLADYSSGSSDPLEPLNGDTFSRRLNSLSQAVNMMEKFHQAFVSQNPRYGKRLPDIP